MIFNKRYISSIKKNIIAMGTKAKLFDPTFSTDSELVIYDLKNQISKTFKMNSRFNKLIWADSFVVCGLENGELVVIGPKKSKKNYSNNNSHSKDDSHSKNNSHSKNDSHLKDGSINIETINKDENSINRSDNETTDKHFIHDDSEVVTNQNKNSIIESFEILHSSSKLLHGDVKALSYSSAKRIFAAGSQRGKIILFNIDNLSKPYSTGIKTEMNDIHCLSFNPQVSHVLAVACDKDLVVLDLKQKKEIIRIKTDILSHKNNSNDNKNYEHKNYEINSLAWHPKIKTAMIIGTENGIFVFDLSNDSIRQIYDGVNGFIVIGNDLFSFNKNMIAWININNYNDDYSKVNKYKDDSEVNNYKSDRKVNNYKNDLRRIELEGVIDFQVDQFQGQQNKTRFLNTNQLNNNSAQMNDSIAAISFMDNKTEITPLSSIFKFLPYSMIKRNFSKFYKNFLITDKEVFRINYKKNNYELKNKKICINDLDKFETHEIDDNDPIIKFLITHKVNFDKKVNEPATDLSHLSDSNEISQLTYLKDINNQSLNIPISYFLKTEPLSSIISKVDLKTKILISVIERNFEFLDIKDWHIIIKIMHKQDIKLDISSLIINSLKDDKELLKIYYYLNHDYEKYFEIKKNELPTPKSIFEYQKFIIKVNELVNEYQELKNVFNQLNVDFNDLKICDFIEMKNIDNLRYRDGNDLKGDYGNNKYKKDFYYDLNLDKLKISEGRTSSNSRNDKFQGLSENKEMFSNQVYAKDDKFVRSGEINEGNVYAKQNKGFPMPPMYSSNKQELNSQTNKQLNSHLNKQTNSHLNKLLNSSQGIPINDNINKELPTTSNQFMNLNSKYPIPPSVNTNKPKYSDLNKNHPIPPNDKQTYANINKATYGSPSNVENLMPPANFVNQPAVNKPTYASPAVNKPTYASPAVNKPTYASPAVNKPTYTSPTVNKPTYASPEINKSTYASSNYSTSSINNPPYVSPTVSKPLNPPYASPTLSKPLNPPYASSNIPSFPLPPTNSTSHSKRTYASILSNQKESDNNFNKAEIKNNNERLDCNNIDLLNEVKSKIENIKNIALSKKRIIFKSRVNEAIQRLKHFDNKKNFDQKFLNQLNMVLEPFKGDDKSSHLEIVRQTIFKLNEIYGKNDDIEIWLPGVLTLIQVSLSD
ncbi:Proline-rich protein 1 [Dictyocoela muelleri]|nr:Proline-rich protein 1 [Dictyocoela muelleri]